VDFDEDLGVSFESWFLMGKVMLCLTQYSLGYNHEDELSSNDEVDEGGLPRCFLSLLSNF